MSRVVCSLGCVCLTLAIATVWGGDTSASVASDSPGPGHAADPGHEGRRIVRIAKKKVRKKATAKKGSDTTEPDAKGNASEAAPAAGDGAGLKFSRDIAPILVGNCTRCHNEKAMAKNGKLDLTSFEKIRKGATHEEVIVPGKPEESHLYLRLTGEETPKMPRNAGQRPLSENAIERIGQWIKEGAKLDAGIDAKASIDSYATKPEDLRKAELAKLTVEQRDKLVLDKGLERWKKGNAKVAPEVTPGKNFMVFAVLPKDRVTSTLKAIDAQYGQIRSLAGGPPSGEPLEKIGLYVFNDRTSFVEFVRSNEGRELDAADQGTARLGESEPYVAVIDPLGGQAESPTAAPKRPSRTKRAEEDSSGPERSLAGALTESLASGMLRRESDKVPLWLAAGVGSYYAARVDPRAPATRRLRRAAYGQFEQGWISKASDALGGETKPEDIRAVGLGIVEAVAGSQPPAAFAAFVRGMLAGGDRLDDTLQKVFNVTREQFLGATGQFVESHYGRLR